MWLGGLEAQFALYRIPTCEISLLKNPGFGKLLYLGLRVYTTGEALSDVYLWNDVTKEAESPDGEAAAVR